MANIPKIQNIFMTLFFYPIMRFKEESHIVNISKRKKGGEKENGYKVLEEGSFCVLPWQELLHTIHEGAGANSQFTITFSSSDVVSK